MHNTRNEARDIALAQAMRVLGIGLAVVITPRMILSRRKTQPRYTVKVVEFSRRGKATLRLTPLYARYQVPVTRVINTGLKAA